jgi:hypothetical protein
MSVGTEFPDELHRLKEMLKQYEAIGPAGEFGATMLRQTIAVAERAWESGDVVAIVKAFALLRGCES